jgi:methylenetetrahydrofolate dehydrogenase (NADP+)/methenyltetrahydrofolate cyclohydrolase
MKIEGKIIAEEILKKLKSQKIPHKFLAGILVGDSPASQKFLEQKKRAATEVDIDFRIYNFREDITGDNLRKEVLKISNHKTCGGVIVQLPLPGHINEQYILNVVPVLKDIDLLGARASGDFYTKRGIFLPPAAAVVEEIFRKFPINLEESVIAVVGAGRLIGRPVSSWLIGKVRELIILDKGSDYSLLNKADIVISGAGVPGLIKGEMLKSGAGLIDFGYGKNTEGKTAGDLDLNSKLSHLGFYTPTPGGAGPILVAKIVENFYKLNSEK